MAVETFEAPHLGMNTEMAPSALGKGLCQLSRNLLPGYPGRTPVRGPLAVNSVLSVAANQADSVWTSATGDCLFTMTSSHLTLRYANVDAALGVDRPSPADVIQPDSSTVPGRQYVELAGKVYGPAQHPSFGGGPNNPLLVWTPGPAGGSIAEHTHSPQGSVGCAYWLKRLFLLSGRDPDSVGTATETALYWTDAFDAAVGLVDVDTSWKDDVSGLVNKIVLDEFTGDDTPTGLAVMGHALVVFGKRSITVIRGDGPSSWIVRREYSDIGCVDARSIVTFEDRVLFAAENGYYSYDGVDLVQLSQNVKRKFNTFGLVYNISAVKLTRDYVLVCVATTNGSDWAGILHVDTRSWTELRADTNILGTTYPTLAGGTLAFPLVTDEGAVWVASGLIPIPDQPAGYDFLSSTSTAYAIQASCQTRLARLSTPVELAKLQRLVGDVVCMEQDSGAEATWSYIVQDGQGQAVASLTPARTLDLAEVPNRSESEAFGESDQACLITTFTGPAAATGVVGELLDTFLLYQPSRPGSRR